MRWTALNTLLVAKVDIADAVGHAACMESSPHPPSSPPSDPREEIRTVVRLEFRRIVFALAIPLTLCAWITGLRMHWTASRYWNIFLDVLGEGAALPMATVWMIHYTKGWFVVPLIATVWTALFARSRYSTWHGISLLSFLVLVSLGLWVLFQPLMYLPFHEIITGLSE